MRIVAIAVVVVVVVGCDCTPWPASPLLVPAGEFLRGSVEGEGDADERPQRRIYPGPS